MIKRRIAVALAILGSCGHPRREQATTNQPKASVAAVTGKAILPDDRTPLAEPNATIDPRSTEAAVQLVQRYGALIEKHGAREAAKLWGNVQAADRFELELKRYHDLHLELGKPGKSEGAAGSIYVTVPVVFHGRDVSSTAFRRAADVILRRINDVPGSTEAQRRWHIEQIEWRDAA